MAETDVQAYAFGSLAGHWTAFVLFPAIAVFCGYAASHIARQFAAPPGQRPYYGTTPDARRAIGADRVRSPWA